MSDLTQATAERQRTEASISVADAEAVRQAVADEVRDLQHSDSPSSGLTKEAAERVVSIVDVHISELIEKARRRQFRDWALAAEGQWKLYAWLICFLAVNR
jgi:hypothetical protein